MKIKINETTAAILSKYKNIFFKVIKEKDTFTYGYHSGIIGKDGKPIQGGAVATMDRSVTYFISGTGSIHMSDPTRGGELILDFDY